MLTKQVSSGIIEAITELKNRFKDLTPVIGTIAALIESAILENVEAGGRWDGSGSGLLSGGTQKWAPLAESTKKKYKKLGYELTPTLNRGGYLIPTLAVASEGTNRIVVSTDAIYGKFHQFGTKHMPARPFITLTNEDLKLILRTLTQMLRR